MRIARCDDEQPCIDRLLALINQYFSGKLTGPELFLFTDPILFGESMLSSHRSFLVNPEYILTIKNMIATLENGMTLNCGKQSYAETLRAFMLWKGTYNKIPFIIHAIVKILTLVMLCGVISERQFKTFVGAEKRLP